MGKPKTNLNSEKKLLAVIFEQHLYNFQEPQTDRKTLVSNIIHDYLGYLRKKGAVIPPRLERYIFEEYEEEVSGMLVKKTYGCYSVEEFLKNVTTREKQQAYQRYKKLGLRTRFKY